MDQESNKQIETQQTIVTARQDEVSIIDILKIVVDPIAKNQEAARKEETKRTEIASRITSRFFAYVFGIALLVLILAGIALLRGEPQLAQTIVVALLSFLGGFGFGRGTSTANGESTCGG